MPVTEKKVREDQKIILVTGGARSGKSSFSQSLAKKAKRPFYIATGWASDDEMTERIKIHKQERGKRWVTIEEDTSLISAISKAQKKSADFILIDCLTFWVSNLFYYKLNWQEELNKLIDFLKNNKKNLPDIVFVSNEVGCGIVPENRLARIFRDASGITNQSIAKIADEVYFCSCGIPVLIKPHK